MLLRFRRGTDTVRRPRSWNSGYSGPGHGEQSRRNLLARFLGDYGPRAHRCSRCRFRCQGSGLAPAHLSPTRDNHNLKLPFTDVTLPMYCRRCSYDLRGSPNSICPECGTRFDRNNALTYVTNKWKHHRAHVLIGLYASVIVLTFGFWMCVDTSKFAGSAMFTWNERLHVAAWQLGGPVAWFFFPNTVERIRLSWALFFGVWGLWMMIVVTTQLRRLSFFWHFLFALFWTSAGFARAGLLMT